MAFQPYPRQHAPEIDEAVTVMLDDNQDIDRPGTPEWFARPSDPDAARHSAERYRAMRSQLLQAREGAPDGSRSFLLDLEIKRSFGLKEGTKTEPRNEQRAPMAPRKVRPALRAGEMERYFEQDERRSPRQTRARPRVRVPLVYVGAGLAAIIAGGVLGYGATHYKAIGAKANEVASLISPQPEKTPASDTVTVVAKKSVATATLNVSDVSGALNSMIPLMLHAEPAVAGHDLILKLSGLPQSAYLTAGAKADDNAWQLAAIDADDVKLVVPHSSESNFDVAVAAFEAKTGELAAPIKEMTVAIENPGLRIAPAAALPENVIVKTAEQSEALMAPAMPEPKEQEVALAEPPSEAQNLLSKGDILLKSGDLGMARRFYERAFAEGSTKAAIGAGKTYDPVVYAELKVHGLQPDAARAMEWYERASSAGNTEAAAAIKALKQAKP